MVLLLWLTLPPALKFQYGLKPSLKQDQQLNAFTFKTFSNDTKSNPFALVKLDVWIKLCLLDVDKF